MCSTKGDPKDEYDHACNSMQEYSKMRFAQLTLFLAITAGLLTVLFTVNPPLSYYPRSLLRIGGLIITFVFFIMESQSTEFWIHYKKRANKLEEILKYELHSTRPRNKITATKAVKVLFGLFIILWLIMILCDPLF